MSAFARLDRIAGRAVDRLNAEAFTLTPMTSPPTGRPAPDLARPPVTGRGILDVRQVSPGVQLGSSRSYAEGANDLRTMQHTQSTQLSCDVSVFAGALPRQGDLVHVRGHQYRVTSARPDAMSRVVLILEGGRQ